MVRFVSTQNTRSVSYLLSNEELDEILGPIDAGCVILVEGLPGTGKTTFALTTAYRNIVERGVKALYLTFGETPEKLIRKAQLLGLEEIQNVIAQRQLKIVRVPMTKDRSLIELLSNTVFSEGIMQGYEIIVIDSVTPILRLLESYDLQRAWLQTTIYDFISKMRGVLILVADLMVADDPALRLLEYVSDIVLEFSYAIGSFGTYERRLSIKKHRFKAIETASYPFEISKHGIRVLNYVARKKREKLLSRRKPIPIDCIPIRSAIGENIEPGTQVLILNRNYDKISVPLLNAWKWLVREILINLPTQGYRVGIISFNAEHIKRIEKRISSIDAKAAKNVVFAYFDPSMLAPNMILAKGLELAEANELDIIVLLDEERLLETLGREILKPYLIYVLSIARALGITIVRCMNLVPGLTPWLSLVWSDIVIELRLDDVSNKPVIEIKKSGLLHRFYDDDFAACIDG